MQKFDIVIIGGGASGLMCANFVDAKKLKTAIIDKSPLGKKILVTGNGRCNLTNKKISAQNYNTKLVEGVIKEFDQYETLNFFSKIGIECFFDDEGRGYPYSETASDVKNALLDNLKNVNQIIDCVERVEKKENFKILLSSGEVLESKNVVVACGNKEIEKILKPLDLSFEQKRNILTGFVVTKNFDKNLLGVRENAVVSAEINGQKFCERGQVQFKKDGISGIVIFNLSAFLAKNGSCPFDAHIELLPNLKTEEIEEVLLRRRQICDFEIKDAFRGLLKPNLAKYILKTSGVKNLNENIKNLTNIEIKNILKNIKDLKFCCENTYDDPQVLSGGIDLKNLDNLQSKKHKGLYFCGESANVFGCCGGYNLQWAWSSGHFVAMKLNKN